MAWEVIPEHQTCKHFLGGIPPDPLDLGILYFILASPRPGMERSPIAIATRDTIVNVKMVDLLLSIKQSSWIHCLAKPVALWEHMVTWQLYFIQWSVDECTKPAQSRGIWRRAPPKTVFNIFGALRLLLRLCWNQNNTRIFTSVLPVV